MVPGARFGPYELLSPVGAGGMGEVWKARDTRIDRIVAIKVSQQQFSERFEREARATAALNHPNICSLYDVGPNYLVMEFVDGEPIRPPQSLRKLLDFAIQIAGGMAAAHDRGITHRDLKPDNILVTNEGRVKILDFGLAKQKTEPAAPGVTQAMTVTEPGLVMGTVSYMSPEQARGSPLDYRSDQFSFGVILYEAVSGRRPFQAGSAPQIMAAIIEAEPEPLPQTVPAPLRWIVERCLAKDPSARYASTHDLYHDLLSLREHFSETVRSAGTAPLRRTGRYWPAPVLAIALACLIAAAGYWFGYRGRPATATQTPMPLTSSGGTVLNPSFSPDGSEVVFAWDGPRGSNHNLYVKLIGSNDLLRLTSGPPVEISPAWSPDGKLIAFVRRLGPGRRALMLISRLGGSERMLTELAVDDFGPEGHSLLAWTPDGRYLAATNNRRLDLISAETGEHQPLTSASPNESGDADPAFSPRGDRFAFVRRLGPYTSRCFWFPLTTGAGGVPRPSGPPQPVRTPGLVTFSPFWDNRGGLVLAAGAPFGMRLYRLNVPNGAATLAGAAIIGGALAFNREAGRLIYTSTTNICNLYRLALEGPGKTSHPPERLTGTTGSDLFPSYSPDSASVSFASFRFAQFGIWNIETGTGMGAELSDWGDRLVAPSDWAPDGKSLLLFGTVPEGQYQIFRLAVASRKLTRLTDDPAHDIYPTFSRDAQFIYFASTRKAGTLQLYKMPASGGAATLVAARDAVRAYESADGRWLYFAQFTTTNLLRTPVAGGEPTAVLSALTDPEGYALAGQGIYYWSGSRAAPALHYLNVASGRDQLLYQPAITAMPHLSLSPDARWLAFPMVERNSQELLMLEKWQ